MKSAMKVVTLLLMGLIVGCGNNTGFPPDVLHYVNIDTYLNNDGSPQVAFDGTNYLVVYDETVTDTNHDIIGAFVKTNGAVLSYINIDTSTNDDRAPRVAFDGTNYLVVYQQTGATNHDIIGVFVRPGGIVGIPFAIDGSPNDDLAQAVAFNGTDYLVVYQRANGTDNDIVGALVDPTGTVLAGSPFNIDTFANNDLVPSVASNGTNFLVAYQRAVNGINDDIQGAVIDPTGPTVTLFGINTSASFDDRAPKVASDGTNYLVVYEEVGSTDRDIWGALVNGAGTTVTLFGIDTEVDFDDFAPSVAFDGTSYLVAYSETFSRSDHDIIGARVDSTGAVLSSGFAIDVSGFDDFSPAVAFGSTDYLVAYEEIFSGTNHDIFGALVKP